MVPEWAKNALLIDLGGQNVPGQEFVRFGVLGRSVMPASGHNRE